MKPRRPFRHDQGRFDRARRLVTVQRAGSGDGDNDFTCTWCGRFAVGVCKFEHPDYDPLVAMGYGDIYLPSLDRKSLWDRLVRSIEKPE